MSPLTWHRYSHGLCGDAYSPWAPLSPRQAPQALHCSSSLGHRPEAQGPALPSWAWSGPKRQTPSPALSSRTAASLPEAPRGAEGPHPGSSRLAGGTAPAWPVVPRKLASPSWWVQLLPKGRPHKPPAGRPSSIPLPGSGPTHSRSSFASHLAVVRRAEIGWEVEGTRRQPQDQPRVLLQSPPPQGTLLPPHPSQWRTHCGVVIWRFPW